MRAEDPLEPGTYVSHPLVSNPSLAVTFTAPEGWQSYDARTLAPLGDDSTRGPDGAAFAFGEYSDIYSDPCDSRGGPDVDGGTTAEDLAAAFSGQTAYQVSVADVSVSGYSGKQVELQLPSAFDASCPREEYFVVGGGIYPQGDGNRWRFTILDVEGSRLVIFSHDFGGTPASIRAGIQSMLDSIEIEIDG